MSQFLQNLQAGLGLAGAIDEYGELEHRRRERQHFEQGLGAMRQGGRLPEHLQATVGGMEAEHAWRQSEVGRMQHEDLTRDRELRGQTDKFLSFGPQKVFSMEAEDVAESLDIPLARAFDVVDGARARMMEHEGLGKEWERIRTHQSMQEFLSFRRGVEEAVGFLSSADESEYMEGLNRLQQAVNATPNGYFIQATGPDTFNLYLDRPENDQPPELTVENMPLAEVLEHALGAGFGDYAAAKEYWREVRAEMNRQAKNEPIPVWNRQTGERYSMYRFMPTLPGGEERIFLVDEQGGQVGRHWTSLHDMETDPDAPRLETGPEEVAAGHTRQMQAITRPQALMNEQGDTIWRVDVPARDGMGWETRFYDHAPTSYSRPVNMTQEQLRGYFPVDARGGAGPGAGAGGAMEEGGRAFREVGRTEQNDVWRHLTDSLGLDDALGVQPSEEDAFLRSEAQTVATRMLGWNEPGEDYRKVTDMAEAAVRNRMMARKPEQDMVEILEAELKGQGMPRSKARGEAIERARAFQEGYGLYGRVMQDLESGLLNLEDLRRAGISTQDLRRGDVQAFGQRIGDLEFHLNGLDRDSDEYAAGQFFLQGLKSGDLGLGELMAMGISPRKVLAGDMSDTRHLSEEYGYNFTFEAGIPVITDSRGRIASAVVGGRVLSDDQARQAVQNLSVQRDIDLFDVEADVPDKEVGAGAEPEAGGDSRVVAAAGLGLGGARDSRSVRAEPEGESGPGVLRRGRDWFAGAMAEADDYPMPEERKEWYDQKREEIMNRLAREVADFAGHYQRGTQVPVEALYERAETALKNFQHWARNRYGEDTVSWAERDSWQGNPEALERMFQEWLQETGQAGQQPYRHPVPGPDGRMQVPAGLGF